MVRPLSTEDAIWARSLFGRRYPNSFDLATTEAWMREVVLRAPLRFHAMRTDDGLCISLVNEYPWQPTEHEVTVVSLVSDLGKVWQAVPLLRESIAWARSRKAVAWRFGSDTAYDCTALMRRIGVPQEAPRFRLDL